MKYRDVLRENGGVFLHPLRALQYSQFGFFRDIGAAAGGRLIQWQRKRNCGIMEFLGVCLSRCRRSH